MRRKFLIAAIAVAGSALMVMPNAAVASTASGTSSTTVTATLTGAGSRVVSSDPAVALSNNSIAALTSSAFHVTVTEVAAQGDPGWFVTAQSSALTGLNPSNTIPASDISVTPGAVTTTPLTGTDTPGSGGALNVAQTLWTNSGQVSTTNYSGTHIGSETLTLNPPTTAAADTYTATLTMTLFQ